MYHRSLLKNALDLEPGSFKAFTALWDHLALDPANADPVCSASSWNLAYHEVFHPGRPILYATDGESLFLHCHHTDPDGQLWATPVEDSWLFGTPLLGGRSVVLMLAAKMDWENSGINPHVLLSGIVPGSNKTRFLLAILAGQYDFYRYGQSVQASASLSGGLDGWFSRRSANHRAKLRKAARKAAQAGMTFERCRPENPEEASALYARMLAVEERSWKGIRQCGMTMPESSKFYGALIRRQAATQAALVIFAQLDGRDVGFIYGGICGGIYRGQQFSFDDSLRHLSPGNLLQLEKVCWLCELGLERYDMGPVTGPRMEYKKHWTEEFREMETWVMRPAG